MRDWVTNVRTTHYILGSALGSHPYPDDGARFSSRDRRRGAPANSRTRGAPARSADRVRRRRQQRHRAFLAVPGRRRVRMIGVEAGGLGIRPGSTRRGSRAADSAYCRGRERLFSRTSNGQIMNTHSISAGLDYAASRAGARRLREQQRVDYTFVHRRRALKASVPERDGGDHPGNGKRSRDCRGDETRATCAPTRRSS